jgi:hypothetical protein
LEKETEKAANLDTVENQANHERFLAKANAYQEKQEDTVKLFNPTDLLARATKIREVNHPTLGLIKYGELTLLDSEITQKCKTPRDKTAMAVYLALKKAYPNMPNYTTENIGEFFDGFPIYEGTELLEFFLGTPDFLPGGSPNGSTPTLPPKK